MSASKVLGIVAALAAAATASPVQDGSDGAKQQPKSFLKETGPSTWVIGNELWNVTQNAQYANKLMYKGKDRVGRAVGHYVSYNGAASNLKWTSAEIVDSDADWIDVKFTAREGDFHWVIFDDLPGAYQYFVNRDLPTLGEFRTLWRLDNVSFTHGHTDIKDGALPPLKEYLNATKVQDETWQKADGTYLTKYDWSAFVRDQTYHGVYGEDVGSWYINPGKDYNNGDHLKQELMVHRESQTGDTVQLNMLHGTHYQATSQDSFAVGKTWGPWLWYLNDGSRSDAAARWTAENAAWPYKWFKDAAYQSRGTLRGRLVLSNGHPASGAAIFLGDNNNSSSTVSTLDQGQNYYYTTYANSDGSFTIPHVRIGSYALYAWGNGGSLSSLTSSFTHTNVEITRGATTFLSNLTWPIASSQNRIFQLGAFDRKTDKFHLASPSQPVKHALLDGCPANLTYTVDSSSSSSTSTPDPDLDTDTDSTWCFAQSKLGTWSIFFPSNTSSAASLILSLAGFSQGTSASILLNGELVGSLSSKGLLNSQDTYRGAVRAGEWHRLEFPVREGLLEDRQANRLDIRVTKSERWRGWLWDSLVLESV